MRALSIEEQNFWMQQRHPQLEGVVSTPLLPHMRGMRRMRGNALIPSSLQRKITTIPPGTLTVDDDFDPYFCGWFGFIKPEFAPKVKIAILLDFGVRYPRVFIIDPPIQTRDGALPPHYNPDTSLCLYFNGGFVPQYRPDMIIADTIVQWAAEWYEHYSFWLVSGEWLGGGGAHYQFIQNQHGIIQIDPRRILVGF